MKIYLVDKMNIQKCHQYPDNLHGFIAIVSQVYLSLELGQEKSRNNIEEN
jgi:hypothetical protein